MFLSPAEVESLMSNDKEERRIIKPGEFFMDPMARIVGNVVIGNGSTIWPGVTLEGDETKIGEEVIVMPRAQIGDNTIIGDGAFISPDAKLNGCRIGDNSFVGMGAVIGEGVVIGEGSVISHDSIIPDGTKIPANSLVSGTPATVEGTVTDDMMNKISEIRSLLDWKREEVKIMLKRGELFGVDDIPGRPEDIYNEFKDGKDGDLVEREKKFLKMFGLNI